MGVKSESGEEMIEDIDTRVEQEFDVAAARHQAEEARQWVVDLAAGRRKWRMCIPVQPDDTDVVLIKLYKNMLAALTRIEELEAAVDHLQNWCGAPD